MKDKKVVLLVNTTFSDICFRKLWNYCDNKNIEVIFVSTDGYGKKVKKNKENPLYVKNNTIHSEKPNNSVDRAVEIFEYLADNYNYEYLVQTDTRSVIHVKNLIKHLEEVETEYYVGGHQEFDSEMPTNFSYPADKLRILSRDRVTLLLNNKEKINQKFMNKFDIAFGFLLYDNGKEFEVLNDLSVDYPVYGEKNNLSDDVIRIGSRVLEEMEATIDFYYNLGINFVVGVENPKNNSNVKKFQKKEENKKDSIIDYTRRLKPQQSFKSKDFKKSHKDLMKDDKETAHGLWKPNRLLCYMSNKKLEYGSVVVYIDDDFKLNFPTGWGKTQKQINKDNREELEKLVRKFIRSGKNIAILENDDSDSEKIETSSDMTNIVLEGLSNEVISNVLDTPHRDTRFLMMIKNDDTISFLNKWMDLATQNDYKFINNHFDRAEKEAEGFKIHDGNNSIVSVLSKIRNDVLVMKVSDNFLLEQKKK